MKKILPIVLILCLFLSGCHHNNSDFPSAPQPSIPESTPVEHETTQPELDPTSENLYVQHPMYAVTLPVISELTHNEESTFTYQNIYLYCQDQEVADRIIIDFLNRQDAQRKIAETTNNTQYDVLYQPMRIDSVVMSLYGESLLHQSRNHPVIDCLSANYNMLSGETLTLGSILKDSSSHEMLQDALLFIAETVADEKQLYDEYPQIIAERFTKNPSFDEAWFFSSTGLCFYFEPYEIAPYISGVVTLEIPYDRLTSIIDASYFPAEEDAFEGNIIAENVDNVVLSNYSQIAEVRLNGYANAVFLHCEGFVRDVKIEIANDKNPTSECTIFASASLSPGDGIMLMYDQTDDMPILRITCRSGQSIFVKNLFFAVDGSIVLT